MTGKPTRYDSLGRRKFLKGAGATGAALGGFAAPAAAGNGNGNGNGNGKGDKRDLEDSESRVEFSVYAGIDGNPNNPDPNYSPDGDVDDPGDFLFPAFPVIAGASDTPGLGDAVAFDTTFPQVTPGEQAIHYVLRFVQDAILVNKPKPYVLTHTGDGRYRSRGATVNFEVGDVDAVPPLFQPLLAMLGPGKYRAVAHDEVQLYEKGGAFDWSVTRAEFYKRGKGGIDHQISLLYVVWDEDGPGNDETNDRGSPGNPFDTPPTPASLPPVTLPTATELIGNGTLNPGGQ